MTKPGPTLWDIEAMLRYIEKQFPDGWRIDDDGEVVKVGRIRREEFRMLRRTIGSPMWQDCLTDDEFRVLQNEIVSCFKPRDL